MKIYTYWDSSDDQANFLRVWERSWRDQGWEPRLLTSANALKSKNYQPSESRFDRMLWALHAVGGGWFSSSRLINNSLKPHIPKNRHVVKPWSLAYLSKPSLEVMTSAKHNRPVMVFTMVFPEFPKDVVVPWTSDWPEHPKCFLFDDFRQLRDSGLCR